MSIHHCLNVEYEVHQKKKKKLNMRKIRYIIRKFDFVAKRDWRCLVYNVRNWIQLIYMHENENEMMVAAMIIETSWLLTCIYYLFDLFQVPAPLLRLTTHNMYDHISFHLLKIKPLFTILIPKNLMGLQFLFLFYHSITGEGGLNRGLQNLVMCL